MWSFRAGEIPTRSTVFTGGSISMRSGIAPTDQPTCLRSSWTRHDARASSWPSATVGGDSATTCRDDAPRVEMRWTLGLLRSEKRVRRGGAVKDGNALWLWALLASHRLRSAVREHWKR